MGRGDGGDGDGGGGDGGDGGRGEGCSGDGVDGDGVEEKIEMELEEEMAVEVKLPVAMGVVESGDGVAWDGGGADIRVARRSAGVFQLPHGYADA